MNKDHILNHDYGYGSEPEKKLLNKIKLKNISEVEVYINDALKNAYGENIKFNLIITPDDDIKILINSET